MKHDQAPDLQVKESKDENIEEESQSTDSEEIYTVKIPPV